MPDDTATLARLALYRAHALAALIARAPSEQLREHAAHAGELADAYAHACLAAEIGPPDIETSAERAFNAYATASQITPRPRWIDLPDRWREQWRCAAAAARAPV